MGTRCHCGMHESAHVREESGQGFDRRRSTPCSMHNDCPRQLVSAHLPIPSTLRCHLARHRVAQHPARSSTTPSVPVAASSTDDTSPDDRRTRPPVLSPSPIASPPCYLHPRVDFSTCRVSTHAPRLQHHSPPIQRCFSRSTFSEPPRIRRNMSSKRSKRAQKYAHCVQRAGRVRNAHHVPPTSTAAFSSTPRVKPSRSCDPSPRHA
ncbi:hypothetical protein K438DRAFT_545466 [Mycena galopus ATCC 62051]|nr:hypothetical protein K438DRAFT_545466 [Mycena galopus ATCC 62051]